jgi:hypothetical protein
MGAKRDRARRGGLRPKPNSMIQGVVKARKCRHCGHHEIGIVTESGEFLALKPGMRIGVFQEEGDDDRSGIEGQ